MSRSKGEILEAIKNYKGFFCLSDLVLRLDYEDAKSFLKMGVTAEDWEKQEEPIEEVIVNYLPFALGKARDHRGISAGRSVEHFENWLWLLGDDALLSNFLGTDYAMYGCPQLRVVIEKFDPDNPVLNEQWFINMSSGLPCEPDCEECAY
jgi:hypothetical protein